MKSRRMRWAGHNVRKCEKKNVYMLLVRKPEGKRPIGRPRRRWIDNIKIELLEIGLSVVDWIGLAQGRYNLRTLVNAIMKLRVLYNASYPSSGYRLTQHLAHLLSGHTAIHHTK
jgi:hypothetical protein